MKIGPRTPQGVQRMRTEDSSDRFRSFIDVSRPNARVRRQPCAGIPELRDSCARHHGSTARLFETYNIYPEAFAKPFLDRISAGPPIARAKGQVRADAERNP